jgi:hypothetical protein
VHNIDGSRRTAVTPRQPDERYPIDPLLIIGRQVPTSFGTYIDLLAVDGDGILHVLELKRDRTPREVVQLFDYGSWVRGQTHHEILALYGEYATNRGVAFETAFQMRSG